MQPVNDSRLQTQVIPARQRTSDPRETSGKALPQGTGLPHDIVTLSSDRSLLLDSSVKKTPSTPVTPAESKALRNSFSVYA